MSFNNGTTSQVIDIPIAEIFCDDDFNCRGSITRMDVLDLMKDIEANGLLQPIVVQPWINSSRPEVKYRIILGHRRFTACKYLGKETIAASIKSGLAEADAMRLNFMENLKRKDLDVIQEAKFLGRFRLLGLPLEKIAEIVGFSAPWVADRLSLLQLPKDIQDEVAAGLVTLAQAKILIKDSYSTKEMYELFKVLKEKKARGESVSTAKTSFSRDIKVQNPLLAKIRQLVELHSMQDMVTEALGPGIETRILGWASGHVSTYELLEDIETQSAMLGHDWVMPQEIRAKAERMKDLS